MATQSFPAFGGLAVVAVREVQALAAAAESVRRVIDDFDRSCSRFRSDSDLMAVNRGAGAPVPVGSTLLEATEAALQAAEATGGLVDPTVGGALLSLGYDSDFEDLLARPSESLPPRVFARAIPGWRTVQVDRVHRTIRLPQGASLDLGATAKALAADRCAEQAHNATGVGVLVSLSGDIATAGRGPDGGWVVRVTDDHRAGADAPGQTILILEGALASSSTTTRRWSTTNGDAHHLIDPTCGMPADGPWRTVSVAAASCLAANVVSTAMIVGGGERLSWLGDLGLPARLVAHDGAPRHLGGWPVAGDDLSPGTGGGPPTAMPEAA